MNTVANPAVPEAAPSLRERWWALRDRWLASPRFRRAAAAFCSGRIAALPMR